jgi:hypothetical protein
MPTIAVIDGIVVMIYPRDHDPPHIHAWLAEHRCKLAIWNGALLEGHLPKAKLKQLQEWLEQHRPEVADAWNEIHSGRAYKGRIE